MLFVLLVPEVFHFVVGGSPAFHLANPGGTRRHLLEIKQMRVQNLIQVDLAIIALDNLSLRLKRTNYLLYLSELRRTHLRRLVKKNDVTELYLLDDEALQVLLTYLVAHERISALELVAHTQRIHHGHYAVESRNAVLYELHAHGRDAADGLGDRLRLANAARLYYYIVELTLGYYVADLLDQVHLKGAADASVLKRDQTVVFLSHYSALLDERGVYVNFTYVVNYYGELYPFLII